MTFQEWFKDYIKDKPFGSDSGIDVIWQSKKEVWDAALASRVIELPDAFPDAPPYACYESGWNDMRSEIIDELEASGIKYIKRGQLS